MRKLKRRDDDRGLQIVMMFYLRREERREGHFFNNIRPYRGEAAQGEAGGFCLSGLKADGLFLWSGVLDAGGSWQTASGVLVRVFRCVLCGVTRCVTSAAWVA